MKPRLNQSDANELKNYTTLVLNWSHTCMDEDIDEVHGKNLAHEDTHEYQWIPKP